MLVLLALAISVVVFFGAMWLLIGAGELLDRLLEAPLVRFANWRAHLRWRWEYRHGNIRDD